TPHPPPRSTLFPYTTLFRSLAHHAHPVILDARRLQHDDAPLRLQILADALGDFERCRRAGQPAFAIDDAGLAIVQSRQLFEQRRSEEHTSELQSRENLVCRL